MVWILVAALVAFLLIVGGFVGALWNRWRVRRAHDAFPCKMRSLSANDTSGKWVRGTAYASWVHDVVLLKTGLALASTQALLVRDIQGPSTRMPGCKLHGEDVVSIRLSLDDGSVVEVATESSSAPMLSGPFLAFEAQRLEGTSP